MDEITTFNAISPIPKPTFSSVDNFFVFALYFHLLVFNSCLQYIKKGVAGLSQSNAQTHHLPNPSLVLPTQCQADSTVITTDIAWQIWAAMVIIIWLIEQITSIQSQSELTVDLVTDRSIQSSERINYQIAVTAIIVFSDKLVAPAVSQTCRPSIFLILANHVIRLFRHAREVVRHTRGLGKPTFHVSGKCQASCRLKE